MRHIRLLRGALAALALSLQAPVALSASAAFWVPIFDGLTWEHLESGQYENSEGVSYSFGPERLVLGFTAVDVQILDHRANFKRSDEVSFLTQNGDGLFQISDGDPRAATGEFRYYIDPEPWFIKAPFDLGESREYTGALRGRYDGIGEWTGTWRKRFTYLGQEEVTTPFGTFMANKFEVDSERTALAGPYSSRDYWTENWWLVDGMLAAKVAGEGGGTADYNGDSVVDRWYTERLTLVAATANAPPAPPTSIPAQTATEGVSYGYTLPQFTDPDGDALTYTFAGLPSWLTVPYPTQNPRYIAGKPPYTVSSATTNRVYTITVTARDPYGAEASKAFTLTVLNANGPPVPPATIPAQTASEGVSYGYTVPQFTDPDADPLTYTFSGLPSWLTVCYPQSNPRYLCGRPPFNVSSATSNRIYTITALATDPQGLRSSKAFALTVLNVNATPVARSIPDLEVAEGSVLQYTAPQFTDPDGDALTYVYSGLPAWLKVPYPVSPRYIAGRAPTGTAGQSYAVTLTATDPQGASASDTFMVSVRAP